MNIGPGGLADLLGWPVNATARCLDEILDAGNTNGRTPMALFNASRSLLWLPNALAYNPPANPNVVRGWAEQWGLIPDCPLKWAAWEAMRKRFSEAFTEGFLKAFDEVCREPYVKGSAIQEQEQEQEQDIRTPPLPPPLARGGDMDLTLPPGLEPEPADIREPRPRQDQASVEKRVDAIRAYAVSAGFVTDRRAMRVIREWSRSGRGVAAAQAEIDRLKRDGVRHLAGPRRAARSGP